MRISFWFLFQFIIFNNYSYCQTFSESDILGEYLSIKDHPKAKDVNLKLRVPIGWEVREGDRPNIVKKFVRDLNMYTIIIKENITFFSRKQSKELLEDENYLDELVQESSSFLKHSEVIDKSTITIDTYPPVPFKVKGKGGSVTIEILPAPRGLGLVAGRKIKNLLKMAGIKDAWTSAKGSTPTMNSTSKAVLNCLRQTFSQG